MNEYSVFFFKDYVNIQHSPKTPKKLNKAFEASFHLVGTEKKGC